MISGIRQLASVLPGARRTRALGRLIVCGLVLLLASGVYSDSGVSASEGEVVDHLLEPVAPDFDTSQARIVSAADPGRLEILRILGDEPGPVTVLSGFDCDSLPRVCSQISAGSFAKAAGALRNRIDAGEDGAAIRCGLANVLYLQGDILGSAKAYTWAAAGYPEDRDIRLGLGNVFVALNQIDEAIREYENILGEPGYRAAAHNNLGNAYRAGDFPAAALAEYRRAAEADVELVAPLFNQAGVLMKQEKFGQAARIFRQVAHARPGLEDAYLFEGLSHLADSRMVLAAVALYRADELGLDRRVLHLALGSVCQELGHDADAARHLERAIEQDPEDQRVYQMLSVSLARLGRLESAGQVLEMGFLQGPQDADAHFIVGLKLFLCDQSQMATGHFMRSIAMGRRKPDTFFALGQSLLRVGQAESAIRAFRIAAMMSPEAPEIHFSLGVALAHADDLEGALREVKTAVALDPDDEDIGMVLMDLLRRVGDYSECARVGEQLIERNAELVAPRFEAAFCHSMARDFDSAAEAMEDALDHDVEGLEVRTASRRISQVIGSNSSEAGPYLLLSMIHERRGDWSDAVRALEQFIIFSSSKSWKRSAARKIRDLIPPRKESCRTCRVSH